MTPYTTKSGLRQYKPSIQEAMVMEGNSEGWCLVCGDTQAGFEPDAEKCKCPTCGLPKVYGPEALVLMGLTYDASVRGAA